ncbi:MAG: hypothetical protein GY763_04225 [Gammaproteobacteria bacterium]|nr:hypothetical protein [Gammaproteobacteria bacterium]
MRFNALRHCWLLFLIADALLLSAQAATSYDFQGHNKYLSLLSDPSDDSDLDQTADFRLNLSARQSSWSLQADYQLLGQHSEASSQVDDKQRLFDLTSTIHAGNQSQVVHRLDRLQLSYSSTQAVFRFGRQAVSWGNGLIYTPMDFFNPFDPATLDKEYKTGGDMFYSQYSFDSGDDLQAVWVGRRDDEGSSNQRVASLAVKYHMFLNDYEIDLLVARHFDQPVIGIGGLTNVGGSIWRGDIVGTEVDNQSSLSTTLNASYSWIAWGKNMSGFFEIYRNGFGIDNGDYSLSNLSTNTELLSRIERGELFTLGKHYLSASATIELTPLWLLTSTLFDNLDDDSKLLQIISQHDLSQNLQLLIAFNLPSGNTDSEFGSADESLFAQLVWYY